MPGLILVRWIQTRLSAMGWVLFIVGWFNLLLICNILVAKLKCFKNRSLSFLSFQRSQGIVFVIKQYSQRKRVTVSVFYILDQNALVSATHPPPSNVYHQHYHKDSVELTCLTESGAFLCLDTFWLGSINHGVVCSTLTETVAGLHIINCKWFLQTMHKGL